MQADTLSSLEMTSIAEVLNAFEPKDVRMALGRIGVGDGSRSDAKATTWTIASGPLDFGSVQPGVLVYDAGNGSYRMRITDAEMEGAFYDEIEGSAASLRSLKEQLLRVLEAHHAPKSR